MLITATDGYIIDILGPYLAKNNDASIMDHPMKTNIEGIKIWFKPQDSFIVDRGYRDCLQYLRDMGFDCHMPDLLPKNAKQHSTEDSNHTRHITKLRWVVESANGRLKKWRYIDNVVPNSQIPFIGDYVRIVAGICNKYRPALASHHPDDQALANKMLQLARNTVNPVQTRVLQYGTKPSVKHWVFTALQKHCLIQRNT